MCTQRLNEKVAADCVERRVCPVVDVEAVERQVTSVIDDAVEFGNEQTCRKQSAAGHRERTKICSEAPVEQS